MNAITVFSHSLFTLKLISLHTRQHAEHMAICCSRSRNAPRQIPVKHVINNRSPHS